MDPSDHQIVAKAKIDLLELKDSDIRIMILEQGRDAIDRGVHIGGAFSAVIPMVSLYFGGFIRIDVEHPAAVGQDMFVLSKGHAVATLASILADLGYFDRGLLKNSRSLESILNGHPGPLLPGIHVATGPEGHGMPVAQGLALAGRDNPKFDVFCVTGDGELQAGLIWEAAMYSGVSRLDNLCVIVDKNEGQLDCTKQLHYPMKHIDSTFVSFGWKVIDIDATQYQPVVKALEAFKTDPRDGRPTVIICNTRKGFGGFSSFMGNHKIKLSEELVRQEIAIQATRREQRRNNFFALMKQIRGLENADRIRRQILRVAIEEMNLTIDEDHGRIDAHRISVRTRQAEVRDKTVAYDETALPRMDRKQVVQASTVVTEAMRVFAAGGRVVSVDADLSTTSGLQAGVGYADQYHALNVGIAESNMACIGEAFAVLGFNTWVSTFCPFFDWRVLRRISIGYQERRESIASNGWLNKGHNLDLTFLATASNFDTATNGSTHMGNDDLLVFSEIAHIKIVDTSCPNQLLGVMRWIMEGDKGLVYLRMMRAASRVIYDDNFRFEYGKGYWAHGDTASSILMVTSGRQVHESVAAALDLEKEGLRVGVVDMPSIDENLLSELYGTGKTILIPEQNNGYIWAKFKSVLFRKKDSISTDRLIPINCLDQYGNPQFIHSATYEQLVDRFQLSATHLKRRITELVK